MMSRTTGVLYMQTEQLASLSAVHFRHWEVSLQMCITSTYCTSGKVGAAAYYSTSRSLMMLGCGESLRKACISLRLFTYAQIKLKQHA